MKWIKYSRYTGEDLGVDAEDLLQALSDFLLESGFNTQYTSFSEANEHTLDDLKRAIERAFLTQRENRGFSLVEVLSPCPTYWRMEPPAAMKHIENEMMKTFPLGVYRDWQ